MDQQLATKQMDEKQLIAQANAYIENEKWNEIISLLSPYHQSDNLSVEGLTTLAYGYSRNKAYSEAIQIYEDLCQKYPYDAKYYYYLAYQYQGKKDFQKAVAVLEKCLELSPRLLKAALALGEAYEEIGALDKAIKVYREAIQAFKAMTTSQKESLGSIYSRLCTNLAKLLLSDSIDGDVEGNEVEYLFRESIASDPQDGNNWYRFGSFLLKTGRPDEAIQYLQKAESLAPKKEYIPHKIAQAYLKKGDIDRALEIYKSIPRHKQTAYILHGMAECLIKKGDIRKGATYLYQAAQREPEKFYHHHDLGIALASLEDRDQAITALEKANQLFRKDHGKDYIKILAKIDEIKQMPQGEKVVLDEAIHPVTTISHGKIMKYNADRGFGFIKDDSDGKDVFFHITRVKDRVKPSPGMQVKFAKEMGEKGLQAAKVWVIVIDE